MSTFLSIIAIIISSLVFYVTRERFRLELFDRRFNIYIHIKNYALFFAHGEFKDLDKKEELKKNKNKFIEAFRQAKFLFKKTDKIYACIGDILQKISIINQQYEEKVSRETDRFIDPLDIENKLAELEELLMPYLYFSSFKQPIWKEIIQIIMKYPTVIYKKIKRKI